MKDSKADLNEEAYHMLGQRKEVSYPLIKLLPGLLVEVDNIRVNLYGSKGPEHSERRKIRRGDLPN